MSTTWWIQEGEQSKEECFKRFTFPLPFNRLRGNVELTWERGLRKHHVRISMVWALNAFKIEVKDKKRSSPSEKSNFTNKVDFFCVNFFLCVIGSIKRRFYKRSGNGKSKNQSTSIFRKKLENENLGQVTKSITLNFIYR